MVNIFAVKMRWIIFIEQAQVLKRYKEREKQASIAFAENKNVLLPEYNFKF